MTSTSCDTYEKRLTLNAAQPCAEKYQPTVTESIATFVAPGLFLGSTWLIGSALAREQGWAVDGLMKKNVVLGIGMLSLVANQLSGVYDHSRISDERYCLTSMIPGLNADINKVFFGIVTLVSGFFAGREVLKDHERRDYDNLSMAMPGVVIGLQQVLSTWEPAGCRSNAAVTGMFSFFLDAIMLTTTLAATADMSQDNKKVVAMYCTGIAVATVALIGSADYPARVKKDCTINDAADDKDGEKRRNPEFAAQMSITLLNFALLFYLMKKVRGFTCCAALPAFCALIADLFMKLEMFNENRPLVGTGTSRSVVYTAVQLLDLLMSTQALQAILTPDGAARAMLPKANGLTKLVGPAYFAQVVGSAFKAASSANSSAQGLSRRLAASMVNVGSTLVPLAIDTLNAGAMIHGHPSTMNLPCYIK